MPTRKRLLITGAAGKVGTALRTHLRDRYDLRLLFHTKIPDDVDPDAEIVIGDMVDFDTVLEATESMDAVVHLALLGIRSGLSDEEQAQATVNVDMKGAYHVFEAARVNGVATLVYASTNHVTGVNEMWGIRSSPDMPVRPDGVYGAGKAFGEALARYYVDRHRMRAFCLRIGNFNGKDEPGRYYAPGQARWLSPRDLAQLAWRCIEAEGLDWGIFYGVSGGAEDKWDISNARGLLGYEPEDDGSATKWRRKYAR